MNAQIVNALSVALLHFVWQGAILTAVAAVGFRLLSSQSAKLRYAFACAVLFAMPLVVGVTAVWELRTAPGDAHRTDVIPSVERTSAGTASFGQITGGPIDTMSGVELAPKRPSQNLGAWVLPIWLLGVALLCGYRAASWLAAQRLRRRAVCATVPEWQQRMNRLVRQLRISRPVAMLESSLTDTPLTMGVLRPVVLLPIGLLVGLPVEQIELILLHELAHIRRHDYLVNLLQTAVESLLFYHPGVWWLSRRIRMEREYCCDDMVVAATDDVTGYARALAELEQRRAVFGETVLAATGGNLMFRIQRLLGRSGAPKGAMSGPLAIVLLLASCVALFGWQGKAFAPAAQNAVTQVQTGSPQSAQNGTPANSAQAQDKVAPQLKSYSFFRAFHEHIWHAVLWFHQLLGIGPPKHTAAIPAEVLKDPQAFAASFQPEKESRQRELRNTAELIKMQQQAVLERTRQALEQEMKARVAAAKSSALTVDDRWNAERKKRVQMDLERELREINAQIAKTSVQEQVAAVERVRAKMERQLMAAPAFTQPTVSPEFVQDQLKQIRSKMEPLIHDALDHMGIQGQLEQTQFQPGPVPTPYQDAALEPLNAPLERRVAQLKEQVERGEHQSAKPHTPYLNWLNEQVFWIITDSERAAFTQLGTDDEREAFIEQFWLRRDPTPGTPENEYFDEHYRRITYANDHFGAASLPGWKSDRGMVYIRLGPPDGIRGEGTFPLGPPPKDTSRSFIWHYDYVEGLGNDLDLTFVNENGAGFRLDFDGYDNSPAAKTLFEKMGLSNSLHRALKPK